LKVDEGRWRNRSCGKAEKEIFRWWGDWDVADELEMRLMAWLIHQGVLERECEIYER
jgi:hypothetical protein